MKYEFLNENTKMELDLFIFFSFYKIIYNVSWFNYFGKKVITYVIVLRFLYRGWNPLNWGMTLKKLFKEKISDIIFSVSGGAPYAFMVWVCFVRCFTVDWIKSRLNAKIK